VVSSWRHAARKLLHRPVFDVTDAAAASGDEEDELEVKHDPTATTATLLCHA
jgi:hypothetical protein